MNQPDEQSTLIEGFPRKGIGNPPSALTVTTAPNETIRTLLGRRTIRRFKDDPVDPQSLDAIVEVGLRSANAGGCQAPIFLVSQDAETNRMLGAISNGLYDEGYYPVSSAQPSTACMVGLTDAFYGAPVVITVFTPEGWIYGPFDVGVCVANMMNAAWSLGLGSCVVSRAGRTFATEAGRDVLERAGIPDGYEAQLHLVIGVPESTEADPYELYPNRVAWL